jgi:hypothetical protein
MYSILHALLRFCNRTDAVRFGENNLSKLLQFSYAEMVNSADQQWYNAVTKDYDRVCAV